jgi:hypothetical protein
LILPFFRFALYGYLNSIAGAGVLFVQPHSNPVPGAPIMLKTAVHPDSGTSGQPGMETLESLP